MDGLFDPTCVPVRVTINKLHFFPNRKMPRFVSVFRKNRFFLNARDKCAIVFKIALFVVKFAIILVWKRY